MRTLTNTWNKVNRYLDHIHRPKGWQSSFLSSGGDRQWAQDISTTFSAR